MKSIKQQYIDLKEGRMSQHNFMRSVRMTLPQYITNVTSFNDTVKILKNKGILNEATISMDSIESALKSYLAKGYSYSEAIRAVAAEENTDEDMLASQYPQDRVDVEGYEVDDEDAELEDMIARAEDELSPEKYKFDDFEGGLSEALNKDIKAFGQDLDKRFKEAGFDTLVIMKSPSSEQLNIVKTKENVALFEVSETPGTQMLTLYVNPKIAAKAESIVNKFQLSDYNGPVLKRGWTAKQVQGAINPGDIVKQEDKIRGMWNFYRLAKVDTKVKNISEAKKKEKKELHPNQIHPQELRMGIKVELEHTDNLDKAKKIALDHLAENPFYYTALKLAGVESPSAPKAKAPKAVKKEKAEEGELVDKINAMKPVKGFEKAKASSNKAFKETNSVVKGVEELTHNAKSVRGLQKFAATGGKMKTIKLKEDYESFLSQKRGEEAAAKEIMQATNADGVKFSVNDMAVAPDGKKIKITGFTTGKDGKMKAMYSAGMFADVYNLDDLEKKPSFRPGVDLGKYDLKSMLEKMVREVMNEIYDGGSEDLAAMARSSNALRYKPETQAIAKKAAESANNKEEAASLAVKLAKAKGITDSEQITQIVDLATSKFMNEMYDGRDNLDETEGIEVKQDNDQIEISADSGDYVGYVEDNGKISFSVVYDNTEDIENEFGEEGITEDNWKEVLGSDHAFVQIIDKIGGDVEAAGDYVQITVGADKLKNHFGK